MKVKLLKKVRRKYPIYFVEQIDYDSHDLIQDIFEEVGSFYYTEQSDSFITAKKRKNDLINYILEQVRKEWTTKIKGRTQRIIKLQ
jgi:hypothetical protein